MHVCSRLNTHLSLLKLIIFTSTFESTISWKSRTSDHSLELKKVDLVVKFSLVSEAFFSGTRKTPSLDIRSTRTTELHSSPWNSQRVRRPAFMSVSEKRAEWLPYLAFWLSDILKTALPWKPQVQLKFTSQPLRWPKIIGRCRFFQWPMSASVQLTTHPGAQFSL